MSKEPITPGKIFSNLLNDSRPQAAAWVKGNPSAPYLSGLIRFYEPPYGGILIEAEIFGLPDTHRQDPAKNYILQIEEKGGGNQHFGGFPVLLSGKGYIWTAFYNNRFSIPDILGRSINIYRPMDSPAADSSDKSSMGSGKIRLTEKT